MSNNQEESLSQPYVNELSQQIIDFENGKTRLEEKMEDFLQNRVNFVHNWIDGKNNKSSVARLTPKRFTRS